MAELGTADAAAERIHAIEKRTTLEGFDFFAVFGKIMATEKEPRTKAQLITLLREKATVSRPGSKAWETTSSASAFPCTPA